MSYINLSTAYRFISAAAAERDGKRVDEVSDTFRASIDQRQATPHDTAIVSHPG